MILHLQRVSMTNLFKITLLYMPFLKQLFPGFPGLIYLEVKLHDVSRFLRIIDNRCLMSYTHTEAPLELPISPPTFTKWNLNKPSSTCGRFAL